MADHYINPSDIFVDINNTWVMSPFVGGTGFSGTGIHLLLRVPVIGSLYLYG
ncbi:MAG: hypothetical protein IPN36_17005 [Bacteroidetes bacterium]|nr:hypothetical protein [Bacteroidota bacterium]